MEAKRDEALARERVLSAETARSVRRMLERVVVQGTAQQAAVPARRMETAPVRVSRLGGMSNAHRLREDSVTGVFPKNEGSHACGRCRPASFR